MLVKSPVANQAWMKSYSRPLSMILVLLSTTFSIKQRLYKKQHKEKKVKESFARNTSAPSAEPMVNIGKGPIHSRVTDFLLHVLYNFVKCGKISIQNDIRSFDRVICFSFS